MNSLTVNYIGFLIHFGSVILIIGLVACLIDRTNSDNVPAIVLAFLGILLHGVYCWIVLDKNRRQRYESARKSQSDSD